MSRTSRDITIEIANLAAAVERAAADLALSEEPAGFITALEQGAHEESEATARAR